METKEALRQKMKALRGGLSLAEVEERSQSVARRLIETRLLDGVSIVALYAPVRNEVQTEPIFTHLRRLGRKTLFPRIAPAEGAPAEGTPAEGAPAGGTPMGLQFIEVVHLSELEVGTWGILEPPPGRDIPIASIDMVILPGLAFDRQGRRLGFGKGYYDRALQNYAGITVGLAFDFQLQDEIPSDSKDRPCDFVVTESELVGTTRSQTHSPFP